MASPVSASLLDQATTANGPSGPARPHIVLVVPRGEAVRNFLYSDTLRVLGEKARVTLLSVIDDERFLARFAPHTEQILPLRYHLESRPVMYLRTLLHEAHFKWLGSEVARNAWELRDAKAEAQGQTLRWALVKGAATLLAHRPVLEALTGLERYLTWKLRPDDTFVDLFTTLQPDLVFNCSHIHGAAGELPVKVAHRMGIPTAGFIFSWDNLTSRSRIFVPYDAYLVWHDGMRRQLLDLYPHTDPERVFVTGTPQFDYHFKPDYQLSREDLCRRLGLDSERPFVLYTTGMDRHFPEEHRTVELVIRLLGELDVPRRPQLVVRTYVKGTSEAMRALARNAPPDVIFPPVQWDERWFVPKPEDLSIYTSLLRHAALGINAASTVSLELLMHDKPVINLGFDPPGSDLPPQLRWIRHIHFDHYRPVAESGAVMVAYAPDEMGGLLQRGLTRPDEDRAARRAFIQRVFGSTLDGGSGERVAHRLLALASRHQEGTAAGPVLR